MTSTLLRSMVLSAAASLAIAAGAARAATPVPTEKVLVIPFAALNVSESQQWISKGVQEDVIADLGRAGGYSPIAFEGQLVVEDNATAVRLARQASADYAVRGAAQIVGENVRLTAQLIDARTGFTVSTASATGAVNDLLALEDQLSAQLRGVPTAGVPATATGPAPGYGAGAGAAVTQQQPLMPQQPVMPQIIVVPSAQSAYDAYPYPATSYPYDYSYGYPSYGYPDYYYPSYYPYYPLIITTGGGRDRHDRGNGHGNPGPVHGGHDGGPTGGSHGGRSVVGNSFAAPSLNARGALPISTQSFGAFHFSQPNPQTSFFSGNAGSTGHASFGSSAAGSMSHGSGSMAHGRR